MSARQNVLKKSIKGPGNAGPGRIHGPRAMAGCPLLIPLHTNSKWGTGPLQTAITREKAWVY
jgi:hypothetical protein